MNSFHCVKSALIRSFSGPYFCAIGLKTERHVHIQSECGKIWTRKTPNTNTFYAVFDFPCFKNCGISNAKYVTFSEDVIHYSIVNYNFVLQYFKVLVMNT